MIHVRRSVDQVLKHLRQVGGTTPWRGIAHAFNGSAQQATACLRLGLKLGFGGAVTFERALQLRRLAAALPDDAIVLDRYGHEVWSTVPAEKVAERVAGASGSSAA